MDLDYNEFLRIMTCILTILLIVQGLDYIFGVGVNNYIFIVFCIVFAFTIGTVYHNIMMSRDVVEDVENNDDLRKELNLMQEEIDREYAEKGLVDEVLDKQIELNARRNELNVEDETIIINKEGFVQ